MNYFFNNNYSVKLLDLTVTKLFTYSSLMSINEQEIKQ